ncbi:hypothetical protein I548_2175 [Mycobacterium intracellulare]|nr:hypothetical protein I548_2175 [Mycobacterium intracellulare]
MRVALPLTARSGHGASAAGSGWDHCAAARCAAAWVRMLSRTTDR